MAGQGRHCAPRGVALLVALALCVATTSTTTTTTTSTAGFAAQFDPTGFLVALNYTARAPGSTPRRVVWDEKGRHGAAWVRYHQHYSSLRGAQAWQTLAANGTWFNETAESLSSALVSHNGTTAVVRTTGDSLEVTDVLRFDERVADGVIEWEVTVRNRLAGEGLATVILPCYLGALNITRPWWLRPDKGGHLLQNVTAEGYRTSYPRSIGTFSPVTAVGEMALGGGGAPLGVGVMWASQLQLPTYVSMTFNPHSQFSPVLHHDLHLSGLAASASVDHRVLVSVNVDTPDPLEAFPKLLDPYRQLFEQRHGTRPTYCPQWGPLMYFVGSNNGALYNHTTHRYRPGANLSAIFSPQDAPFMHDRLGVDLFGVWATALYSSYLTTDGLPCEFNPNIDLIDPSILQAFDRSAIQTFTDRYAAAGMRLFHFARPCLRIAGANISYHPDGTTTITKGVCAVADLTDQSQFEEQMGRLAGLVARGVKGFYFDAMSCKGDTAFLSALRARFPDLFFMKEGCRDADAHLWPQIPILKLPSWPAHNSLLIRWLTPHATVYGGKIDQNLNQTEFDLALDNGYIGVVQNYPASPGHPLDPDLQANIRRSYANRYKLYEAYGKAMGCPPVPAEPPTLQA